MLRGPKEDVSDILKWKKGAYKAVCEIVMVWKLRTLN